MSSMSRFAICAALLACATVLFSPRAAFAQDEKADEPAAVNPRTDAPVSEEAPDPLTIDGLKEMIDTVWVLVAGMLVFFMNLGFGCVEAGMARAKNTVNILSKNFIVFAVASIGFYVLGWGLMFGNGDDYIGKEGLFALLGEDNSPATGDAYQGVYSGISWTGIPLMAKFFFQLVFVATAATIVSGAVAERIKYHSFILFSFVLTMVIYPIVGHWIWGGGWLQGMGFLDFAGSTQVHSIGGWAALTGVYILGPRLGKYSPEGKVNAIPGHNLALATIGCFVLWLGWFGFNPGSTMGVNPGLIAHICVTTNSAAAAAALTSTATAWILLGKPDLGMTLNGALAGLVAITAGCAFVSVPSSLIIGAIGGVLVVIGVLFFDKIRADDPVGATSVHLLNGVFGTLCVGLFADPKLLAEQGLDKASSAGLFFGGGADQLIKQLTGVGAAAGFVLVTSAVVWIVLKATVGIRVSAEEEQEGLDHGEHGNQAYPYFVMTGK